MVPIFWGNIQPKTLKRIYYREFFNFPPLVQIHLDKAQWLPSIFDGPHSSIIEKGKENYKKHLKTENKKLKRHGLIIKWKKEDLS